MRGRIAAAAVAVLALPAASGAVARAFATSTPRTGGAPAVTALAGDQSYRVATSDGHVSTFGAARSFGQVSGPLAQPIVGMAATPSGNGYWLVATDGGIFAFGDAHFYGSTGAIHLNRPIVGMASTPTGHGYWLVASDGGIFAFGDARFFGSTGAIRLNKPVVGMTTSPDGNGYWFVATDGGIFAFGDARFFGSTGNIRLNQPIAGMAATAHGSGYWMVANDGGMFSFGDAQFYGSAANARQRIVGMASTVSSRGYYLVATNGQVFNYGDAQFQGSVAPAALSAPVVTISLGHAPRPIATTTTTTATTTTIPRPTTTSTTVAPATTTTTTIPTTTTTIGTLPTTPDISAGANHTCVVTAAGAAECWGQNDNGQLGDGTTSGPQTCGLQTCSTTPVAVIGLSSGVKAISAGFSHTCALTTAGGVKCWGLNAEGQLGDGTGAEQSTPVDVTGLTTGVIAISAGDFDTCAVTATGGAKCWGINSDGELGDGTVTQRNTPVDVSGLTAGVTAIAAGSTHTCAVVATGVECWGANDQGQLGDGTTVATPTPVDVSGLSSGVSTVSAGAFYTCALTTTGGVKCWGDNSYGQLGNGNLVRQKTPVDVTGLTTGAAAISAASTHVCAMTGSGGADCWGNDGSGQLGNDDPNDTNRSVPVAVVGLPSAVTAIGSGALHSCALVDSGGAECWGANTFGQLGNGTTTDALTPVAVSGF